MSQPAEDGCCYFDSATSVTPAICGACHQNRAFAFCGFQRASTLPQMLEYVGADEVFLSLVASCRNLPDLNSVIDYLLVHPIPEECLTHCRHVAHPHVKHGKQLRGMAWTSFPLMEPITGWDVLNNPNMPCALMWILLYFKIELWEIAVQIFPDHFNLHPALFTMDRTLTWEIIIRARSWSPLMWSHLVKSTQVWSHDSIERQFVFLNKFVENQNQSSGIWLEDSDSLNDVDFGSESCSTASSEYDS
jgi:hypothetical protein